MPTLAARDAERVLRFVADAETAGGDVPFTGEFLAELGRLVEADWVTYCELDRVRRRVLRNVARTGDEYDDDGDDDAEVFWQIVIEEHPVCVQHQRGDFRALKLSDFVAPARLRKTRLWEVWFQPYDIRHELNVPIPSPLWHTKTFLFDRSAGRDFTERDRLVLDLLQPHFARMWEAARARRLLTAALAELERANPADNRGVVFVGADGRAASSSPPARRMLRAFFGERGRDRLPAEVAAWLESASGPLVRRREHRELEIERIGDALILRERQVDVDLTRREREVLAWVARGKTNGQIAELLWLAPSTVRKHLENVYAKLGVSTRTAAAARFLGLLDAEAS